MMTDIVGPSYTLEVEAYFSSMQQINPRRSFWMMNDKLSGLHQKFIPFCSNAQREYFLVEHDN